MDQGDTIHLCFVANKKCHDFGQEEKKYFSSPNSPLPLRMHVQHFPPFASSSAHTFRNREMTNSTEGRVLLIFFHLVLRAPCAGAGDHSTMVLCYPTTTKWKRKKLLEMKWRMEHKQFNHLLDFIVVRHGIAVATAAAAAVAVTI